MKKRSLVSFIFTVSANFCLDIVDSYGQISDMRSTEFLRNLEGQTLVGALLCLEGVVLAWVYPKTLECLRPQTVVIAHSCPDFGMA